MTQKNPHSINNSQPTLPDPEAGSGSTAAQPLSKAEIDERMAYIDGVNGSAGHHLDDPYLRSLVHQQIAGEITGDEARELGRQYLETGRRP
ncbi:hypothetical protein AOC05_17920 [Arthrobacter alpinus]|uniref:Antitoxin VbhA domain-containing protein n=1 Tax=Arthrobacter alpinus TaxID=656366 RepID=A0A0M5M3T9_9MICC|nr:antitoxin VbhA family protein [Arthrobacter alpinus]ALE93770.1 hypothetical protein AOC05_17920 [Arthrobacter alpinus]